MPHTLLTTGSPEMRDVVNELADALDDLETLAVANEVGDGTITEAKLDDDSVDSRAIIAGAVDAAHMSANSIDSASYVDGSIDPEHLLATMAAKLPGTPTIALAAIAGRVITATITLKDVNAVTKAAASLCTVWVSDAAGGALAATAPSDGITATTGLVLGALTADKAFSILSHTDGTIVLDVEEAAADTFYLNVAYGGVVVSSAVLTFPAP